MERLSESLVIAGGDGLGVIERNKNGRHASTVALAVCQPLPEPSTRVSSLGPHIGPLVTPISQTGKLRRR